MTPQGASLHPRVLADKPQRCCRTSAPAAVTRRAPHSSVDLDTCAAEACTRAPSARGRGCQASREPLLTAPGGAPWSESILHVASVCSIMRFHGFPVKYISPIHGEGLQAVPELLRLDTP